MTKSTQPAMAGDILDGYHPNAESEAALDALLKVFDALEKPHWHMIGNHCLYNLPREVGLPRHNNLKHHYLCAMLNSASCKQAEYGRPKGCQALLVTDMIQIAKAAQ